MKTKEELNALKEEVETLNKKLHELTEEELEQVSGGNVPVAPGGHPTYSFKNNPTSTYCGATEEMRLYYAGWGYCDNCKFNPPGGFW